MRSPRQHAAEMGSARARIIIDLLNQKQNWLSTSAWTLLKMGLVKCEYCAITAVASESTLCTKGTLRPACGLQGSCSTCQELVKQKRRVSDAVLVEIAACA